MKIAILTDADPVWSLWVWERAVPLLQSQHTVCSIWVIKGASGKIKNNHTWYIKTFGLKVFILLACYTVIARLSRALRPGKVRNFHQLSDRVGIAVHELDKIDDIAFASCLKHSEIDVLFSMVSIVLGPKILDSVRIGVVNKHASLLPANRGLMPYFWAVIKNQTQGVTYHYMDRSIDKGEILYQYAVPPEFCGSMILFYYNIFERIPSDFQIVLKAITEGCMKLANQYPSSYHGLPTKDSYRSFFNNNGKIIRIADLKLATRM